MLHTILRTTWHHIVRTRYISALVVAGFTLLFVTGFVGISMMGLLRAQKIALEERFTYPLFINNLYTFQSPRVQSFVASLADAGITGGIRYVTKEDALDQEIQRNPDIVSALGGENPLPDMMMIPIYHTDLSILWSRVQEFRDIFDSVQSFESLRSRLKKFENSLQDINHLVHVLIIFIGLTVILGLLLVFMMMRYQARLFRHEQIIGHLVGAHPLFFWGPHVLSLTIYAIVGGFLSYVIVTQIGQFF